MVWQIRAHVCYNEIVTKMRDEKNEEVTNRRTMKKAEGRAVAVGDVIQLMHGKHEPLPQEPLSSEFLTLPAALWTHLFPPLLSRFVSSKSLT